MDAESKELNESKEKNKSKSYFDLYPNISQKSNNFNGSNIYDKSDQNSSSSK